MPLKLEDKADINLQHGLAASWKPDIRKELLLEDESGNGYHGYICNSVQLIDEGVHAVYCNGTHGNYIQVENFCPDLGNGFTIVIRLKALQDTKSKHVILSYGEEGHPGHFEVYIRKDIGLLAFYSPEAGSAFMGDGSVGCGHVDDNRWHCAVISYDGESITFYLDRVIPIYSFKVKGRLSKSCANLRFGATLDDRHFYNGFLGGVQIYDRAINEKELNHILVEKVSDLPPVKDLSRIPEKYLYEDPVWDCARDGCIIRNNEERNWWYIYMQQRNGSTEEGTGCVHGTSLGAASSSDGGLTWEYRGMLKGLELDEGKNTFWAPDVIRIEGKYHAYITYLKGIHYDFSAERDIVHYSSDNLLDWKFESKIKRLPSRFCIDACIYKLPDGRFGLWYKDDGNASTGFSAGNDLDNFTYIGAIDPENKLVLEGADVFFWKGYYWLLGDDLRVHDGKYAYHGIAVYRSIDCIHWEKKPNILDMKNCEGDDLYNAHHADAVIEGGEAYVFYWHCREYYATPLAESIVLRVAGLRFDGDGLTCDPTEKFELRLS